MSGGGFNVYLHESHNHYNKMSNQVENMRLIQMHTNMQTHTHTQTHMQEADLDSSQCFIPLLTWAWALLHGWHYVAMETDSCVCIVCFFVTKKISWGEMRHDCVVHVLLPVCVCVCVWFFFGVCKSVIKNPTWWWRLFIYSKWAYWRR